MLLNLSKLLRIKMRWLAQNLFGDADLANVVQQTANFCLLDFLIGELCSLRKQHRKFTHSIRMASGIGILRINGCDESTHRSINHQLFFLVKSLLHLTALNVRERKAQHTRHRFCKSCHFFCRRFCCTASSIIEIQPSIKHGPSIDWNANRLANIK